jgi:hypothetical protein
MATAAGKKHSADVSSAPEDKHKRKEKRTEKEGAASPETKPHDSQGSPSLSPDKRRRDEKQRSKEESRRESKLEVACDQQRRASSELLRGHKEKGRAFWNKERTPRRGILSRSLSAESLARTSTKCASLDDETLFKRKKHKKHKRKGLQDEGVKFDKVVVRHYPREVCIGGCMLDPNQGPFLGTLPLVSSCDRLSVHGLTCFTSPALRHWMGLEAGGGAQPVLVRATARVT